MCSFVRFLLLFSHIAVGYYLNIQQIFGNPWLVWFLWKGNQAKQRFALIMDILHYRVVT